MTLAIADRPPYRSRLTMSIRRDCPVIIFPVVGAQVWLSARSYIALAVCFGLLVFMPAVKTLQERRAAKRQPERLREPWASPAEAETADP